MFAAPFVALALASQALATVYMTSPTGSSSWPAGQEATITWQDDGVAPTLEQFGNAKISIYAGNAQQQTLLQSITESVNVATTSSVKFTPDASIGPDSTEYFIRVESIDFKDPKQPQYPALSFSAKFALTGMSGQFSSDIQAQIAGQSTAPLAGQTSAPAAGSSTSSSAATTTSSTKSSSTGSSSGSAASSTSTENAAIGVKAGWVGLALSALVGVTMF